MEEGEGDGAEEGKAEEEEEEAVAYVPRRVHTVSQEEEDDFDKMMAAAMADAKKATPKPPPDSARGDPLAGLAGVLKRSAQPAAGGEGVVSLRVLRRGGGKNKLEADEVSVPASEPLARTVLAAGEEANEERQRLKRQILNIAS